MAAILPLCVKPSDKDVPDTLVLFLTSKRSLSPEATAAVEILGMPSKDMTSYYDST